MKKEDLLRSASKLKPPPAKTITEFNSRAERGQGFKLTCWPAQPDSSRQTGTCLG